jgi:hypothetical protein
MLARRGVAHALSAWALALLALALLAPGVARAANASSTTSSPSASTAALGNPVTDSATVTGQLLGGVPSGTVTFFACGPLPSASGCAAGGTQVGAVTLTPGLGDTATAVSPSFVPTAAGTWCFRAEYSGDGNYDPSSDGSSNECFTVPQDSSSTASAPQSGSVAVGAQNVDVATITGTSGGGSPTGTVSFYVCGPLTSAAGCPTGGQAVGSPITVTAGAGNTAGATSSGFTPTAPGTWCFRADYSGDGNYVGSSDASPAECFTVTQASSGVSSSPQRATVAVGGQNTDTAKVAGNSGGGSPTGTVTFYACGPLTSAGGCVSGGQPVGSPITLTGGTGNTATATSSGFTPTAPGTWCFRADYSGDANYTASTDGGAGECFTVTQASSAVSSSPHRATVALGQQNTDTATLAAKSGGAAPTGTVTFYACGPLTSATGCASGGQAVGPPITLTGAGNTATATSSGFTPTAPGTWCFRADYSGDGNYTASADGGAGECFTVTRATPTVTSAPTTPTVPLSGGTSDHVLINGNPAGGSPTGAVWFFVCGPLTSASGCPTGGQAVGTPIPLAAGPGNATATATSAVFTPPSAGVWCFRADYSGDGNYTTASDGGSGECFTVPQPHGPSATIASPTANATYAVGQIIPASYSCAEDAGGPGLASCTGSVADGTRVDTSNPGVYTFAVTATSRDGLSTTVFARYIVAGAPWVTISTPANGATYMLGQGVGVNISCGEGPFGSGLKSCAVPTHVDTSHTGTFAFSATVTSVDGQSSTSTVHYRVVAPSNHFVVSRLRRHRDGRVTFVISVPAPGTVKALATASGRTGKPRPFVFGRLHRTVPHAVKMPLLIPAGTRERSLIRHGMRLRLALTVTFTPTGSRPHTAKFSKMQLVR